MNKQSDELLIGVVGVGMQGGYFKDGFQQVPGLRVHAVCDIDEARAHEVAGNIGADKIYTSYEEMLDKAGVDAVFIATPNHLHAPQAIAALERGIHVLCEVTAAVSIEECRALVAAQKKSVAVYMIAENYIFHRPNLIVREIARRGLLGQIYHASGEFMHNLRAYCPDTPWRRKWHLGIDGITYGTHTLGPLLQCMPGDRIARLCCEGSGHHYKDERGEDYAQDTSVALAKTVKGALIKLRVDMLSIRPGAWGNYELQGTDGCYESLRGWPGSESRIWMKALNHEKDKWTLLRDLGNEYLPDFYKEALEAGIVGKGKYADYEGDSYFLLKEFWDAIRRIRPAQLDIHAAMDYTLPGLVSQQSIRQDSEWLEVPDSREW